MKTYRPVYSRAPNIFLRYEERTFDDKVGHTGIIRVAIFLDKNKRQCEMVSQVIWNNET
jgi:hypothetical protein